MLLCVFWGGGGSSAQGHTFPVLGIYNNFLNFPDRLVHLLKNPAGSESAEREPGMLRFKRGVPGGSYAPAGAGSVLLIPLYSPCLPGSSSPFVHDAVRYRGTTGSVLALLWRRPWCKQI